MSGPDPLGRLRRHGAGVALLFAVLVAGCTGDELGDHLRKGQTFFAEENFEEAQLEGLYVILREPDHEDALRLVARSLLAQNRDGEAEGYFKRLVGRSPLHAYEAAALYEELAREDYRAGQKSRAGRRWAIALQFEPLLDLGPYGFFMAARAYDERNWTLSALLYQRALANFPDSSAVKGSLFPYGVSLHQLERRREALDILEPFIRSYPRHPRRHEAIWLYQEILIHEAKAANARMDYEGAVEYLRKALRHRENPPMTAEGLLVLGSSYENLQDYDAAAACYRRVIEESSTDTGRIYDSAVERLSKLEKARLK
jgi:tetratricopeptide (TPR) repeat protein